jgi:hypothetical protein
MKLVNILAPLIFLLKVKKVHLFFLQNLLFIFLKFFLAKSFKTRKVRYLYEGLVKILKNMVSTMFRYKNAFAIPKKS